MSGFVETDELGVTPDAILAIWRGAVPLGWTRHAGTLLDADGTVTPLLFEAGHALGCRFERDGEVVGLHVYSDPTSPAAQLTLPVGASARCSELVRMVAAVVGTSVSVDPTVR